MSSGSKSLPLQQPSTRKKPTPPRSFLYRLGGRCLPQTRRHGVRSFGDSLEQPVEDDPAVRDRDFLENLRCELVAAATRADVAATMEQPEEMASRARWLSRVYVRIVVDEAKHTLAENGVALGSAGEVASPGQSSSDSDLDTQAARDLVDRWVARLANDAPAAPQVQLAADF